MTSALSGNNAIRCVAASCSGLCVPNHLGFLFIALIRLIVSWWCASFWLKDLARLLYVISVVFRGSGVWKRRVQRQNNIPSWVGPMPPVVTTKSYLLTSLLLASILKKIVRWAKCRHISRSRHFFFIICNHLYPLSEVHALDLLTKVIGFTSDRGVQIDPLFEAVLCKAVGILIQGFAIQYFISNSIVDESTSTRMIWKK